MLLGLFVGGVLLRPAQAPVGVFAGPSFLEAVNFAADVQVDSTITLGGGEVSLDSPICTSVTWNPGAVVSSTVATTSLTLDTTYSVGDILSWGLGTSTCAASNQGCLILTVGPGSSTSTAVAQLSSPGSGNIVSIDVATATLSVCYLDVP